MKASDKAAAYDAHYPESVTDFGQKVERMERIQLKQRKRDGGGRSRFHTVPALPWHEERR